MTTQQEPTILVYRRTHKGDPNPGGLFGVDDCMKSVREWAFNAVIGIGGSLPDPGHEGISKRLNWIGIGPKWHDPREYELEWNNKVVTFDRFVLFDKSGPLVKDRAPKLYEHMFCQGRIPRTGKNFNPEIYGELKDLLKLADGCPPSSYRDRPDGEVRGVQTSRDERRSPCGGKK
jgi:hypothetical protein